MKHLICAALLVAGCSDGQDIENQRRHTSNTNSKADDDSADAKGDSSKNDGQTQGDPQNPGDTNTLPVGGPGETFDSRAFFAGKVTPLFEQACTSCHADPRFDPPVQGPLTIFSFDKMEAMLLAGESATNNDLYNKVTGVSLHSGGDRCLTDDEVCTQLQSWWKGLRGETVPGTTLGGQVATITEAGRVSGWAADRSDSTTTIPIRVYIDGDFETGTLVHETEANAAGFDNGTSGNHAFSFSLPEAYRDGREHTAYIYGLLNGDYVLLPGAPQSFTAYSQSAEGMAFFNNNIRATLAARCGSCHAVDYSAQWASLINPPPDKGGTATNNELINKPSGQISHGGGNICGGTNGTPCSLFQQWWNLEFN